MSLFTFNSDLSNKLRIFFIFQVLFALLVLCVWQWGPKSHRFEENQLGVIEDLQKILQDTVGGERIILLGGSSFGFSISAKTISEKTGLSVINLGTHAGLGFSNIWSLYRGSLNSDKDTIIVSPEYGLLKNISGVSSEYCLVIFLQKNIPRLISNPECIPSVVSRTISDTVSYARKQRHGMSIYYRSAYNRYGDIESHLELPSKKIDFTKTLREKPSLGHAAEFVRFVNSEIIDNGFRLMYVPVLLPNTSCSGNEEYIHNIQQYLSTEINGFADNLIEFTCYPDNLFFNTEYHMNSSGREIRTIQFQKYITNHI